MRPACTDLFPSLCGCITKTESTSSAIGQEGEGQSAATGQAVFANLSLPGLKMPWPSSQLILEGVKTVEARPYALGNKHIAQPGVEMWLVETPAKGHAVFDCWLFVDGAWVSPMPKKAQIVGTVTFSGSDEYGSLCAFRADRRNHRIAKGGQYDWDGTGKRYAWRVSAFRRLEQPAPHPGGINASGFRKFFSHTAIFAKSASIAGPIGGEGAFSATTGKRSTPASHDSAASVPAKKSRKRSEPPEESCPVQDHLEKRFEEEDNSAVLSVKASNAAFMIVKAGSQRSRGRSQAECSSVVVAGHGSQSATGSIPASLISSGDATAQREGGVEQEQLRARLFRVQGQLKKSLEDIEDISQLTGVPRTGATLPAS